MDKNDFWTLIVAAVAVFLASLPAFLDSLSGASDNFRGFRWLLIAGPLAIIGLAAYGRSAQGRNGGGGEVG